MRDEIMVRQQAIAEALGRSGHKYVLDRNGALHHWLDTTFEKCAKHVFTIYPQSYAVVLQDHAVFANWQQGWDAYLSSPLTRSGFGKLTGYRLPNSLYQIEVLMQRWQVGCQGTWFDGPFLLTTDASINDAAALERALNALTDTDLRSLLNDAVTYTLHANTEE